LGVVVNAVEMRFSQSRLHYLVESNEEVAMPESSKLFPFSSAAQGAYAFFNANNEERALVEPGQGDFTSTEAKRFLGLLPNGLVSSSEGFDLRHHQADEPSGFSASVFFDRAQSKYVLSVRGTAGLVDIFEDINRIGLQGFAGDQAASLYRYYRKLTTPGGQRVNYSESEFELLNSLRVGLPIKLHFSSSAAPLFRSELARDVGIAPKDGSAGSVIPAGVPLVVTGHSLGGHLALLFGRLFPSVTEHVYTYNSPGINPIGAAGLWTLGIPQIDPAKVTNIASAMGSEMISLIPSKPGERIPVFTEKGTALYQHSIVPLTDSLALYGAFATLSPGLSGDPSAVSGIISAASPYPEDSLEAALDQLMAALGTDGAPTLVARTLADLAARDNYYEHLYTVLDSRVPGFDYQIASLVGKTAAELSSMAGEDVAVRFALHELASFAVRGADFSEFEDNLSGQWIAGRAEWLAAKLEGNLVERDFGFSGSADNVLFRDLDADLRYSKLDGVQGNLALQISGFADRGRLRDFLDGVAYSRKVVFGSNADEQILGASGGDRLFGAAGGDSLDGDGGDDYMEGGAGEDSLFGGAGDDTLVGGEGMDRLEGGVGDDAYVFAEGFDADTIVDRDGGIFVGEERLTGGIAAGGSYVSGDGQFTYAFGGDGGTLVVNGILRVEGFRNGDLGIRLEEGESPELVIGSPSSGVVLLGDFDHAPVELEPGVVLFKDEFDNPLPISRTTPVPGKVDTFEEFPGTPDETHFQMGGGDDRIQDIFGGNDWIDLGSGNDLGFGGAGNDLLEGGEGRDMLAGGWGNDELVAGTRGSLESDLDSSAVPSRPGGGDLLSGGDGDDLLIGDAEANVIEGGAGLDRIFAGSGDDWIGSDVAEFARWEHYVEFLEQDPASGLFIGTGLFAASLWHSSNPATFSIVASQRFGEPGVAYINSNSVHPLFLDKAFGDVDEIDAGSGDDTVVAGGGDDVIYGGWGNDYIDAGKGSDRVYGGEGRDYIQAQWDDAEDYFDAGGGDDVVSAGGGDDTLIGGDGDDRLHGGRGSNTLNGGDGNDYLSSSGGDTFFDGGSGNDWIFTFASPGQGSRVVFGRGSGTDLLEALGGTSIVGMLGDISPAELSVERGEHLIPARDGGGPEFETLTGIRLSIGSGSDSLFLADPFSPAFQSAIRIEFTDGTVWDNALIQSLLAPDDASGGTQDPASMVSGIATGDLLFGTAGDDTFSGAEGDDWMLGGAGNDAYLYAQGDGFDLIEDTDSSPGNADVLRFADELAAEDVDVFAIGEDYVLTMGDEGVRIRGGRTPDGAIEQVEFADSTTWSAADLEARAQVLPVNRAPEMPALLGRVDVDAGSPVEIAIPGSAISDPDWFDALSFYAVTADGDRLPDWLAFDATNLTFAGTPGAADAGSHEILLIAADSSGAAAIGSLTIAVGGAAVAPDSEPLVAAAAETAAISLQIQEGPDPIVDPAPVSGPAPVRREEAIVESAPVPTSIDAPVRVGIPIDPLFRDMQQRFDVLLQVGRANLGERYAEAIREFEERRVQQEEAPPPPPPTDEEVAAWNSAMHAWHDRNPGFAETVLGGGDGTWSVGWGLPGPGDSAYGGSGAAAALPGLANPNSISRIAGVAATPMLGEGIREIR
jgi:Ca2+-binding RTX toxin-like protein